MKATLNRIELLKALGMLKTVIPNRSIMPIITKVAIRATKGKLELQGTDLDVNVVSSCKATVDKQGAVCVPIRTMESFVKNVKSETVTIAMPDKKHLKLTAGASITLDGMDIADFPPIQAVKGKFCTIVNLDQALKEVSYAVSKDDARPALNGISFTPNKGKLELASADGFRLAVTNIKAKMAKKAEAKSFILPLTASNIIERYMPGKIEVFRTEDTISFVNNGTVMTARLIIGTFPGYNEVIPTNGSSFTFDSDDMKSALAIVSGTVSNGIVRLRTKTTNLVVSTVDEDVGETSTDIKSTGRCKIAFNTKYLKDVLNRVEGTVKAKANIKGGSPVLIKYKDTIHVIMPMFVQWQKSK